MINAVACTPKAIAGTKTVATFTDKNKIHSRTGIRTCDSFMPINA